MSVEENKAIVERWNRAWHERDWDTVEELVHNHGTFSGIARCSS